MQRVAASGRTCVNVWGAVSRHGLGPLHRIIGPLTSVRYCDIVNTVLVPYVRDGSFHNDFIFQQDNAPIHTTRVVKDHLEQCAIPVLPWCAKGADLNIMENVWGHLKTSMVRQPLYSATRDELWATVSHEWEVLRADPGFVSALYESLPSRISAVIAAGGEMTRY